jgi:hypothetical protein
MRSFTSWIKPLAAHAALAAGCSVPASIDVGIGPYEYSVDATMVSVPAALQNPSTMTVASIACMDDSGCPQLGAGEPAVHCVASLCDPDPFAFDLASDIDLDENAMVRALGSDITAFDVQSIQYTATASGLQNTVGPTELYWGPASAPALESPGVVHFGTIPAVQLADGTTTMGDVALDPDGTAQLSQYLVNTAHQLRLFARPSIDLSPGGPLPSGSVTIDVSMTVHVVGQLVR